jgi:hypothetical protein
MGGPFIFTPPSGAVLEALTAGLPSLTLLQQILHLSVRPGVNIVDFRFVTAFPAVPIVEVTKVRSDSFASLETQYAFPLFTGLRQVHTVHFEGLRASTRYTFLIRASGAPGSGVSMATVSGAFMTGSRSGRVVFERLVIWRVSDNEMEFACGVYDGTTEELIGPGMYLPPPGGGKLECGTGELAAPFPPLMLPSAPSRVHVYIWGREEDDDWEINLGLSAVGRSLPLATPTPRGIRAYDDSISGDALATVKLAEFPGPPERRPFSLSLSDERFSFTLDGFVESTATPGFYYGPQAFVSPDPSRPYYKAVARLPGLIAAVATGGRKTMQFTIGPDGGAYLLVADAANAPRGSWKRVGEGLAGPMTVIVDDRGAVDMFAVSAGDGVLHGHLSNPEQDPAPVWRHLEANIRSEITTVRSGSDTIGLFALDPDGAVRHFSVERSGEGRRRAWDNLGGSFRGPIFAVGVRGGFHVFVSDQDRGVFHKEWSSETDDSQRPWTPLGRGFVGPALAHVDQEGTVTVVGFRNGAPAVYKTLAGRGGWKPEGDAWSRIEPGRGQCSW